MIPSVKYSWVGSFERFSNGKTATERTCWLGDAVVKRSRQFPGFQYRTAANAMAAAAASRVRLPAKARVLDVGPAGDSCVTPSVWLFVTGMASMTASS